jgi:DNA-binding SARP family transcriptional activator/tetratricopeptide (TPR) repeat protein
VTRPVSFGVLGPLSVRVGDAEITLAPKLRIFLACLLLRPGRTVPVEDLVDALWGAQPPRGARHAVQSYVLRLRTALGEAGRTVLTQPSGYLITVPVGGLDLQVFREHVANGRAARATGDLGPEARELRGGLALWRGEPICDVPSDALLRNEAQPLAEERMEVLERRVEIDLELGAHAELVSELRNLVANHPVRENLHGHLMLALYRCNRQAEALQAYAEMSRFLRDELGLDPCEALQDLHQRILADDQTLHLDAARIAAGDGAPARVFQLPPDVSGFVGRAGLLAEIAATLAPRRPGEGGVPMVVLSGPPGVGKTALAIRAGHTLRASFPDGQLYVNMHGYSLRDPVSSTEVLAQFLRALGVPPAGVPTDLEEQGAMFRSLLSDRRILVTLDNVASAEQVRPLLPGGPSAVVVTSRNSLLGLHALDGAKLISVPVVAPEEGADLLAHFVGERAGADEPAAIQELVAACGYLPLAIRITGANIVASPDRPIASHLELLGRGRRLGALAIEGDTLATVRHTFDLSYESLEPDLSALFCLLSLVPGPHFDAYAAASLAGTTIGEAAAMLGRLATANLIDEHPARRYQFHDLIREYARERSEARGAQFDAAGARGRLFDYYLHAVDAASRRTFPDAPRMALRSDPPGPHLPSWDTAADALRWMEAEAQNLMAAVHSYVDSPLPVWYLADALHAYLRRQRPDAAAIATMTAALKVAERDGSAPAMGAMSNILGGLEFQNDRHDAARQEYTRAIRLFREAGDLAGQARGLRGLASVTAWQGNYLDSVDLYRGAVRLFRRCGDLAGEGNVLSDLGTILCTIGDAEAGVSYLNDAREIAVGLGIEHLRARTIANIALNDLWRGDLELATAGLREACGLWAELGYRRGRGESVRNMAEAHLEIGRPTDALTSAREALAIAAALGSRWLAIGSRVVLADAHRQLGDIDHALAEADEAHRLAVDGVDYWYPAAALSLAACLRTAGAYDRARGLLHPLTADARPRYRGRAHCEFALLAIARHDYAGAHAHAQRALKISRRWAYRLDERRALDVLSRTPDAQRRSG